MEEVVIAELSEENREAFYAMIREYLPHSNIEKIKTRSLQYPGAFKVALLGANVIGVVYGWPRILDAAGDDTFTLDGIAICSSCHRKGYGRKLLQAFERAVREYGFLKVSVGSAGGYAECFYIACGYRPVQYKIYQGESIVVAYEFKEMEEYVKYQRPDCNGFTVLEKYIG